MNRACRTGDALIHQRSSQVVDSGVEAGFHAFRPQLHPRGLDVGKVRVQHQPSHGVDQHRLPKRRPRASLALQKQRGFHVDEGQGHEFGEASGLLLKFAQAQEVPRHLPRRFDVPEHQRGGGAKADLVGIAHHGKPLRRVELVRTDDGPHLVVQHLGGGSGQGVEARVFQQSQERLHRQSERLRPLPDFQRREGVDVHFRNRRLDRRAGVKVGLSRVARMNPALQAHLRCSPHPRFLGASHDLIQPQVVRLAPQVFRHLSLGKRTEAAAEGADVRVVDVAVDGVSDPLPALLLAEIIGGSANRLELVSA